MMMTQRFLVRLAVMFAVVAFPTATFASHSWNNYHWARTANPFTLLVVDSMTPDWDVELNTALTGWSAATVLDLSITSSDDSQKTRKRCSAVQGQMRVCNAEYGLNGWLGLASIYLDSNGHITQGTAKMNDSYSSYWSNLDEKNHVVCQEIGHVLGLDHTSTDGSSQGTCMDYSSDPNSQWPNQHDFDELAAIYAHLDSYNSYDTGSSGGGGGVCSAPPGKGCNKNAAAPPMGVRVHRGHNYEIWVAPGKDGGMWIHHIRLVPDHD